MEVNIKEIEKELKETCKMVLSERDYTRISRLVFESYDSESKSLVICAEDATAALYASRSYSHILVEELERIVGAPASIICKYKPISAEPHERFTIQKDRP